MAKEDVEQALQQVCMRYGRAKACYEEGRLEETDKELEKLRDVLDGICERKEEEKACEAVKDKVKTSPAGSQDPPPAKTSQPEDHQ